MMRQCALLHASSWRLAFWRRNSAFARTLRSTPSWSCGDVREVEALAHLIDGRPLHGITLLLAKPPKAERIHRAMSRLSLGIRPTRQLWRPACAGWVCHFCTLTHWGGYASALVLFRRREFAGPGVRQRSKEGIERKRDRGWFNARIRGATVVDCLDAPSAARGTGARVRVCNPLPAGG